MSSQRGADQAYGGEEMSKCGIHRGRRCEGGRCVDCRVGMARISSGDGQRERENLIQAHLLVDVATIQPERRGLQTLEEENEQNKSRGEMKAEML